MASRETKRQKTLSLPLHLPSVSRHWRYDVFPSFRGEDVRSRFLSHVRKEFHRKGIITFDDNGMERSESISHELARAIQESRTAIVVLSKNYASSSWCLNELLHITSCKDSAGLKVIPVFYEVDPSDVRNQTGDFGRAFEGTCAGKSEEEKRRWSRALTHVAGLAGEHSNNWDSEADMIERIAIVVSEVLNLTPSRDFDDFVGMGSHMENLLKLLWPESDEVRFVGIWGPAGIGKTAIARALFQRLSSRFSLSSFLENVRGIYERSNQYSSQLRLQQRLLSEIFDLKDVNIGHLGMARERLKHHNVLLVLDDVDELEQLEALASNTSWFGPGSRIIVTTQNIKLLKAHKINHVYKMPFPTSCEALEIFSRYCFGKRSPPDDFHGLAVEVTELSGNLPLALTVLGSCLRGESKAEWDLALPRLRTTLDSKIEKTLKVGFDSLSHKDRSVFLHIACLFNNEEVGVLSQLFAKSELNVEFGLKVLVERSLIRIDTQGVIRMHSLLEQLGKEIVRGQSEDPGKRQFLWEAEDISEVLSENTGTKAVFGISLNLAELADEVCISDSTFERMRNLKLVRFFKAWSHNYKVNLLNVSEEGLSYLPSKLSLLQWECYPMKAMPCRFRPQCLVRLEMRRSRLEKLWDGIQPLGRLKYMNLNGCKSLKQIPDLSDSTSLEKLELLDCKSLVTLPSSLRQLNNLEELLLWGCSNLEALPSDNIDLDSLSLLDLGYCSKLKTFPQISRNIEKLNMTCTAVGEVPSSIQQWSRLTEVVMNSCRNLKTFPRFPASLKNLCLSNTEIEEVPPWIEDVSSLELLWMISCRKLKIVSSNVFNLDHLRELELSGCKSFADFPAEMCLLSERRSTSVRELRFSGCAFESIPDFIKHLSELQTLRLDDCKNLISLPELPATLHTLHASNCKSLERISGSFSTQGKVLNFINCFKLNQEAREIIQEADFEFVELSGGEIPKDPPLQATGNSLTIVLDRMRNLESLRFKACVVIAAGTILKHQLSLNVRISCRSRDKYGGCKQYSLVRKGPSSTFYNVGECTLDAEHVIIASDVHAVIGSDVQVDETAHNELVFEFSLNDCRIRRCGLEFLQVR